MKKIKKIIRYVDRVVSYFKPLQLSYFHNYFHGRKINTIANGRATFIL
jgi:hypothetical protein